VNKDTLERETANNQNKIYRQLILLQEAINKLSSSLDQQKTFEVITREFSNIFSAAACSLRLWNEQTNQLSLIYYYGLQKTGEKTPKENYQVSDYPILIDVLAKKKIIQLNVEDQAADENSLVYLRSSGFKSMLLVPLVFNTNVIGLLEVFDNKPRIFEDFETSIVTILANFVSSRYQLIKQLRQLERNKLEQSTLQEASKIISSSLNLNEILTRIAHQVCNLVDATSVYISGFDPSLRSSTILAEYFGADASEKERVSDLDFVYDHTSELSIIEKSMQTGEPMIYHIDGTGLIEADRSYLEKYGGKSVLEIPLKRGGEFNAIIEIWETRHKREFTKNEILLCKTLAQHAAIAIENADLYNQAQKEIESRMFVEEKLRHETLHDSLTGLANRNLFIDRLEQAIYRFTRNEETRFSVMYLDLDKLKQINDTLGHGEGDLAIIQVARALQKSIRKGDTVSRFGGDEFLILLEGTDNSEIINKVIERINSLLGNINIGEDQSINLSASIGIAVSSTNIKNSDDYIQFADIAMYSAKKKGGDRSEFYNPK